MGFDHARKYAVVAAINSALGNIGTTVEYLNVPHFDNQNNKLAFSEIVSEIASRHLKLLSLLDQILFIQLQQI